MSHTPPAGSFGYGLYVTQDGTSPATAAIYGEKTSNFGAGVSGWASAQAGSAGVGVRGDSASLATGVGVYAIASGVANTGYALQAVNNSATGWNIYSSGTSPNYFAGNVGIGTATPLQKLHVYSAGPTDLLVQSTTNGSVADTSYLAPSSGGTSERWITGMNLGTSNADYEIYDGTLSASRLLVQRTTGNVGIGTTSPSSLLTVAGDITSTGNITSFSV